ncbi:hypothetical protein O3P69_010826 [Scylla paramamosain]|uniref:Translation initiation factor 3 N-terminal domain-containing protein n=1 Tax=Scylla paramamosain TaxID=85552 RepID=A0AAW0TGG5_SCYPA
MAAVKCGLRRVRPVMATRQLRIYFFLPSSSSSTPFQYFLHPKSSFHSLSSSSYLCLQPKPSSLSSSSSSHSFLPSSSSSSSFSHCFLHPKSSFHSVSSIHPSSIHPPFLHSQTHLLTLHSSHHSCPLSVSPHLSPLASLPPLSSPSTSLHPARFSTSPLSHKTRTKVEGVTPEGKKHRPDKAELVTLIDTEDKVSVVSLENAERLAKRRDLKLVKVEDVNLKGGRKAYKLMTGKQYLEKEIKAKKSEKKTSVGGKVWQRRLTEG